MKKTTEQRILELENRISKIETTISSSISPDIKPINSEKLKKLSAKEFLINKKLKSETNKTLSLGYYLEYIEDMKSFNVDDLIKIFQLAKEKRPQNVHDTVNKNIIRGFLMEVGEKKDSKKAWVLTTSGENFVENKLKNN